MLEDSQGDSSGYLEEENMYMRRREREDGLSGRKGERGGIILYYIREKGSHRMKREKNFISLMTFLGLSTFTVITLCIKLPSE